MTEGAALPLDELYRDVILDHYRNPRHRGSLADASGHFEGFNPVCGDEVMLDLRLDGSAVGGIAVGGVGCSISQASASMLADCVLGKSVDDVRGVIAAVRAMMMEGQEPGADLGDLEALAGVAKFPVRVKCALLSWNVLEQGLDQLIPAA